MPFKLDILSVFASVIGTLVLGVLGLGGRYLVNRAAKPRINSSVRRSGMMDASAIISESLVLESAQMQQRENSELRKEQRENYTAMLKLAQALGRAEGKLEAIAPLKTDSGFSEETNLFLSEPQTGESKDQKREGKMSPADEFGGGGMGSGGMGGGMSGGHFDSGGGGMEMEFLPKSQRKPHILNNNPENNNEHDFGQSFQQRQQRTRNTSGRTGGTANDNRTNPDPYGNDEY
jgi:uncharacterized membrane protein YgcG